MALEAEEVLKIKPSTRLQDDVLAWALDKHGVYTVRSAYRLLKDDQQAQAMSASNEQMASGNSGFLSAVWKLSVPPKIRVFWWRVLHNSLPSKLELKRWHVEKESYCEVCGDPAESLYHVFFRCPVAKRFWKEVKKLTGVQVPELHPASWATDIFRPDVCTAPAARWLVCGAWALWTGRNNGHHGRKVWEPGASARYISSLLEGMATLKMPTKPIRPARPNRWKPPELGWCKVNCDASFDSFLFGGCWSGDQRLSGSSVLGCSALAR